MPKCRRAREEVDRLGKSGGVEWLGIVSHLWTDGKALARLRSAGEAADPDGGGYGWRGAFRTFGIRRFPAIALIDKEGRLVRVIGPDETDIGSAAATLTRLKDRPAGAEMHPR